VHEEVHWPKQKTTSWDTGGSVTSYSFLTPSLSISCSSKVEDLSQIEQSGEMVVPCLLGRSGFKLMDAINSRMPSHLLHLLIQREAWLS